jgi:hypothetical protein
LNIGPWQLFFSICDCLLRIISEILKENNPITNNKYLKTLNFYDLKCRNLSQNTEYIDYWRNEWGNCPNLLASVILISDFAYLVEE